MKKELSILLLIENKTDENQIVELFNTGENYNKSNFGQRDGVTISSGNILISYSSILSEFFRNNIEIDEIHIQCDNDNQFKYDDEKSVTLTFTQTNIHGQQVSTPLPFYKESNLKVEDGLIKLDFKNMPNEIHLRTGICFSILPKTHLSMYIYDKSNTQYVKSSSYFSVENGEIKKND